MKFNEEFCSVQTCKYLASTLEENKLLKKHNEVLMGSLESITDGIYMLDENFNIIYANKAMEQFAGLERGTIIGKNVFSFTPKTSFFHEALKKVKENLEPTKFEGYSEFFKRWMEARIFPAEENGIAVYLTDLTEKRKAEKEVERLDTLNLVGQMAASMGHEVRNPLTTVRGYLQFLMRKPSFENHIPQFEVMIEELDRATSIIKEFLSLSNNYSTKPEIQDINVLIKNLSPLLLAQATGRDREYLTELGDTHLVNIDSKEMRQLIINLFKNAIEATTLKGTIKIRTFSLDNKVVVAVENDGPTIPEETLEKLGTPFYSTKPSGTGLGLAICYSIAARHNAQLKIKSKNELTVFELHIPVAT